MFKRQNMLPSKQNKIFIISLVYLEGSISRFFNLVVRQPHFSTSLAEQFTNGWKCLICTSNRKDTTVATCHLPVCEYFQVSGISKKKLTGNIEKHIIIIQKGGTSHRGYCVGGADNGSNEGLCRSSG